MSESAESVYLFRHALVRDAAYALFPPAERVALHRQAIDSFEQLYADGLDAHAEELLEHAQSALEFADAADTPRLVALEYRYLKLAADLCARNWRTEDEARYLLSLEGHSAASADERAGFMLRRAQHLHELSSLEAAEQLADDVVRAADTGEVRYQALYLRYLARYEAGKLTSHDELDDLLETLQQEGASQILMQALIARAIAHQRAAQPEEAERGYDQAVDVARKLAQPEAVAEALFERGLAYHRQGHSKEGKVSVTEALEIARRIGNRKLEMQALNRLGIIEVESGRLSDAAACYEEAREIAHAIGAQATEATIANNLANLHFYFFGNLTRAEQVYLRSLEFFRERSDVHSIAHSNGVLGLMYHAAGEHESARRCFTLVRDTARMQNDRITEAKAYMGLAFCPLAGADLRSVMEDYREAITRLRAAPSAASLSRTWVTLADELLHRGHLAAAAEALEIAVRQEAVESFRSSRVSNATTRHALLVGDNRSVEPKRLSADADAAPLSSVSQTLLNRFLYAAGNGAELPELKTLRDEMFAIAQSFESARYRSVRDALQLVDLTVRARAAGEKQLWRGLALSALPAGLSSALAGTSESQTGLDALLPGLPELAAPLPVK